MYGDGQRKGQSRWDWGPPTEPQLKQQYHGLGEAPTYTYTGNPVSWLVSLTRCIPFLQTNAGEQDKPVDQEVANDILSSIQGGSGGAMEDTGSVFTSDPNGRRFATPAQVFNQPVQYDTPAQTAVPMGTIHGRMVPLWGSRKTYKGG
jgi:hypothetical protein